MLQLFAECGNYILLVYLISYIAICRATNIHHSKFTENPLKANQLFTAGRFMTVNTRSLRACMVRCGYSMDCQNLVYHAGQCHLYNDDVYGALSPVSELIGAKFYRLQYRQMARFSNLGKSQICKG